MSGRGGCVYASSASEGLFPAWHDSFLELLFLSLIFWICCVVDVLFLFLYRMDASVPLSVNVMRNGGKFDKENCSVNRRKDLTTERE